MLLRKKIQKFLYHLDTPRKLAQKTDARDEAYREFLREYGRQLEVDQNPHGESY